MMKHDNCDHVFFFSFPRSSLASYILGLDAEGAKNRKHSEDMLFSVFSALLDALLLRAQVLPYYSPLIFLLLLLNLGISISCDVKCTTFASVPINLLILWVCDHSSNQDFFFL